MMNTEKTIKYEMDNCGFCKALLMLLVMLYHSNSSISPYRNSTAG